MGLFCEFLVKFEKFGYALALGHGLHVEAIGLHHGAVVLLMGTAKLNGHHNGVIHISE